MRRPIPTSDSRPAVEAADRDRADRRHSEVCLKLDHLTSKLCTVQEIITGNGEPSRGMIVRLDRIEQMVLRHKWLFRLVAGALLATGGSYAVAHMVNQ